MAFNEAWWMGTAAGAMICCGGFIWLNYRTLKFMHEMNEALEKALDHLAAARPVITKLMDDLVDTETDARTMSEHAQGWRMLFCAMVYLHCNVKGGDVD